MAFCLYNKLCRASCKRTEVFTCPALDLVVRVALL